MANLFKMSIFGQTMQEETNRISPMFALNGLLGNRENESENEVESEPKDYEEEAENQVPEYEDYQISNDESAQQNPGNAQIPIYENYSEENESNEAGEDLSDEWVFDEDLDEDANSELPTQSAFTVKQLVAFFSNVEIPGAPLQSDGEGEVERTELPQFDNEEELSTQEAVPVSEMTSVIQEEEPIPVENNFCPATCSCVCPSSTIEPSTPSEPEPQTESAESTSSELPTLSWLEPEEAENEVPSKNLNLNLSLFPCARTSAYQLNLALRLCRRDDEE